MVPETPFSIQTMIDLNKSNAFSGGIPVILRPDESYYKKFKGNSVFLNHSLEPYLFLAKLYLSEDQVVKEISYH